MVKVTCKIGFYFLLGAIAGTVIGLYMNMRRTPAEKSIPKIVHLKESEEKMCLVWRKILFSVQTLH